MKLGLPALLLLAAVFSAVGAGGHDDHLKTTNNMCKQCHTIVFDNKEVQEGYTMEKEQGAECPASNPYPYLNGEHCCAENMEKVSEPLGDKCDGSKIGYGSGCCKDDKHVECPKKPCKDTYMKEYEECEATTMPTMCDETVTECSTYMVKGMWAGMYEDKKYSSSFTMTGGFCGNGTCEDVMSYMKESDDGFDTRSAKCELGVKLPGDKDEDKDDKSEDDEDDTKPIDNMCYQCHSTIFDNKEVMEGHKDDEPCDETAMRTKCNETVTECGTYMVKGMYSGTENGKEYSIPFTMTGGFCGAATCEEVMKHMKEDDAGINPGKCEMGVKLRVKDKDDKDEKDEKDRDTDYNKETMCKQCHTTIFEDEAAMEEHKDEEPCDETAKPRRCNEYEATECGTYMVKGRYSGSHNGTEYNLPFTMKGGFCGRSTCEEVTAHMMEADKGFQLEHCEMGVKLPDHKDKDKGGKHDKCEVASMEDWERRECYRKRGSSSTFSFSLVLLLSPILLLLLTE